MPTFGTGIFGQPTSSGGQSTQPTLLDVNNSSRALLQGGDTSTAYGLTDTALQPFFSLAYVELYQAMAQVQTPRIRREFYAVLPAYTTYLDPLSILVTDLAEPETMYERGTLTQYSITATSATSPIQLTLAAPHGLMGGGNLCTVTGVAGTTAPWGRWYATVDSSTTVTLNGSISDGAAGVGGVMAVSPETFIRMAPTMDIIDGPQITNRLGQWQWEDSVLKFYGASADAQIFCTYWASAAPPSNPAAVIGVSDSLTFLSTRSASLAAMARGWYEMGDRLEVRALGPSRTADASGGLLRNFLGTQVVGLQRTMHRKQPFRPNTIDYPGSTIFW